MVVLSPDLAPHLYLGVKSNADKSECGAAFARATRRLKLQQVATFSVQDLTSALSSAERRDSSNFTLQFVLPANLQFLGGPTIFQGDVQKLDFTSEFSVIERESANVANRESMAGFVLAYAFARLWEWDWTTASSAALLCLKLSRVEDLRDEALNVLAASFAMRGESDKAIDALRQAVAGRWNMNLQGNLVVLASTSSPALAVEHLSHLVLGAETPAEKLGASRMAVDLWSKVTAELGDETAPPMPRAIIDSFYELLGQSGLSEEEFFDLGFFLSETDEDKARLLAAISKSLHGGSVVGNLLKMRAESFGDYGVALVRAENSGELSTRPWLLSKLNGMVETMNQLFLSDEVENKPVDFAFGLIDNGLKCKTLERISLLAFMMWHLRDVFTDENQVPKSEMVTWVVDAHGYSRARDVFADRNPEHVELVRGFIQSGLNALMFLYYRGYWNTGIQVERHLNQLVQEGQRWFPNRIQMRESARGIVDWADGVTADCKPLRLRCDDHELNPHVDELLNFVSRFRQTASAYL